MFHFIRQRLSLIGWTMVRYRGLGVELAVLQQADREHRARMRTGPGR